MSRAIIVSVLAVLTLGGCAKESETPFRQWEGPCNARPVVTIDAPERALLGREVTLRAHAEDTDGEIVHKAWDLDNSGIFETVVDTSTEVTLTFTGEGHKSVSFKARDDGGAETIATATIWVSRYPSLALLEPWLSIEGHEGPVTAVGTTPDGAYVLSTGLDGFIRLWRTSDGSLTAAVDAGRMILTADVSPDSTSAVTAEASGIIRTWSLPDLALQNEVQAHDGNVLAVEYSPDGSVIATGGADGMLKTWFARKLTLLDSVRAHETSLTDLAFSPVEEWLATIGNDWVVHIWDSEDLSHAHRFEQGEVFGWGYETPVPICVFTERTGSQVCWGRFDGVVVLQSLSGGLNPRSFTGEHGPVRCAMKSPDDRHYVLGNEDGTVTIVRPGGDEELVLEAHTGRVKSISASGSSAYLASGGDDGVIRIYSALQTSD